MAQAPRKHERLLFGNIELTPMGGTELWYVPGGRTATTKELIALGDKRDIKVSKLTIHGLDRKLESLN